MYADVAYESLITQIIHYKQ